MSSAKAPPSEDETHVSLTKDLVKKIRVPLLRSFAPHHYLDEDHLEAFGIDMHSLDFDSGRYSGDGPQFIELAPLENIENWLDQAKPLKSESTKG